MRGCGSSYLAIRMQNNCGREKGTIHTQFDHHDGTKHDE